MSFEEFGREVRHRRRRHRRRCTSCRAYKAVL